MIDSQDSPAAHLYPRSKSGMRCSTERLTSLAVLKTLGSSAPEQARYLKGRRKGWGEPIKKASKSMSMGQERDPHSQPKRPPL